jgi:hypothetical protein
MQLPHGLHCLISDPVGTGEPCKHSPHPCPHCVLPESPQCGEPSGLGGLTAGTLSIIEVEPANMIAGSAGQHGYTHRP